MFFLLLCPDFKTFCNPKGPPFYCLYKKINKYSIVITIATGGTVLAHIQTRDRLSRMLATNPV